MKELRIRSLLNETSHGTYDTTAKIKTNSDLWAFAPKTLFHLN